MPDISCATWDTKEDKAMSDEWAKKGAGNPYAPSPEVAKAIEKIMPQVERAIEERCLECLQENVENARKGLIERLHREGREPTDLERFDLEVKPTEKEYRQMYKVGKELGMQPWEIINCPVIIGVKDPGTLERLEGMEARIIEEMSNFRSSKLSSRFRDVEVVDQIIFIDKEEPAEQKNRRIVGAVLGKSVLVNRPDLSRTVHIFRNPETAELPQGKEAHWIVIHEICHLNIFKEKPSEPSEFTKIFVDNLKEWERACNAQLDGPGPVSIRAGECIPVDGARELAFSDPEFIAEHVAAWDTELAEICPEMNEFFNKYLTK